MAYSFVCLCFGKYSIPFEQMDQCGRNFHGLLDRSKLTYGWEVLLTGPYLQGYGQVQTFPPPKKKRENDDDLFSCTKDKLTR